MIGSLAQACTCLIKEAMDLFIFAYTLKARVDPINMLLHIAFLRKCEATEWNWTNEWLLITVCAEMSIKFTEGAKDLVAGLIVFREQFIGKLWYFVIDDEVSHTFVSISFLIFIYMNMKAIWQYSVFCLNITSTLKQSNNASAVTLFQQIDYKVTIAGNMLN